MRTCRPLAVSLPCGKRPDTPLQHPIGVKASIFAQVSKRERGDQCLRRMAEREVARHKPRRRVNPQLLFEDVKRHRSDRPFIGGKVIELLH
jgi:hypothetical protein